MKKIVTLVLFCISIGISAQEPLGMDKVKNDQINSNDLNLSVAFQEDHEAVLAFSTEHLSYDKSLYYSKTYLDPHTGAIAENDRILIKKELFDDSKSLLLEGMLTFSKDRKTVFFSVNRKLRNKRTINGDMVETKKAVHRQLFKARVNENGEWTDLEMLPFNSARHSTGQPYLNQNDTKLYFVSDGPESLGRTDIFAVDLYDDGTYGTPENLGPKINSIEREMFPYINKDNLLYFSSDVMNKNGDLNVFVSKIFDHTISTPIKLGADMNIEESDFAYEIYENEEMKSFSSKEQAGKGVEEIYASVEDIEINIECQQEISGIVKNGSTDELLPNVQIVLFDEDENKLGSFLSSEKDASFSFQQSCNTNYTLKSYLDGYLTEEMVVKTVNDLNAAPLEIVMNMSTDRSVEDGALTTITEVADTAAEQTVSKSEEANDIEVLYEDATVGSSYNFKSEQQVFTVQIGAFNGKAKTDKFIKLSSLFSHVYDDGLNRYYSGVFESRAEAVNYLNLLRMNGFKDAFVVGLKGNNRF